MGWRPVVITAQSNDAWLPGIADWAGGYCYFLQQPSSHGRLLRERGCSSKSFNTGHFSSSVSYRRVELEGTNNMKSNPTFFRAGTGCMCVKINHVGSGSQVKMGFTWSWQWTIGVEAVHRYRASTKQAVVPSWRQAGKYKTVVLTTQYYACLTWNK